MKVILSADSVRYPLTGIGRYTKELALGLRQALLQELWFMQGTVLRQELAEFSNELSEKAGGARRIGYRLADMAKRSSLLSMAYAMVEPGLKGQALKRALKNTSDHVFHGPNFYLPKHDGPSVATIHDLSMYKWAHTHPRPRVHYMRKQLSQTLSQADLLITDTEYTRLEVAEYFNWPLERIRAVHLAGSGEFYPRPPVSLQQSLAGLGLQPTSYVLYIGTVEPRKNLETLLLAYELLPTALRSRFPLIVCGYRGWLSDGLHRKMADAQRAGWLHYLGFIDESLLPLIMAGARLFVYPSLYEGFGLPVLEAMASGVPVICSNASTLPEVTGGAAALHEPEDVDGLNDWILCGLQDDQWCAARRVAGLARAAQFTWERCVQETLKVYRELTP